MAIKLIVRVWEECELSRAQQTILVALADHAHDDGTHCYPSVDLIAWKTGYERRAVQQTLKELREMGVLRVLEPARQHKATHYQIMLDAAPRKQSFGEWKAARGRGAENAHLESGAHDGALDPGVHFLHSGVHASAPKPPVQKRKTNVANATRRGASLAELAPKARTRSTRKRSTPRRENAQTWAMVDEYLDVSGITRSTLTDRQLAIAYDALDQLPRSARAVGEIKRVTHYMRSLWQYRNPGTLKIKHIVDAYAEWVAGGRPVIADDGKRDELVHTGTDVDAVIDQDAAAAELERRRKWREDRGLPPEGMTPLEAARRAAARAKERAGT